jgi:hypothetical protein
MFMPNPAVVQQAGGKVVWVKKKGPEHVVSEYWIFCWLGPNAFSQHKELFDRVQACSQALGTLAIICRRYNSNRDRVQEFHTRYRSGPVTIPFEAWNAHQVLLDEVVVDIESLFWFANRLLTHVALTLGFFFKKIHKPPTRGAGIQSHSTLVKSSIFGKLPLPLQQSAKKLCTEISDFRNEHVEHDMKFWHSREAEVVAGAQGADMQLGITISPQNIPYPQRPLSELWIPLHDYVTEVAQFLGSQIK